MTLRRAAVRRRPKTPQWLVVFALRLYGRCCIRCGASRPLEVAHLDDWRATNRIVARDRAEPMPMLVEPEDLAWLFRASSRPEVNWCS
jgi:hypothetical protein